MQWAQKQKGFTIVELLIVIVVIAILAAVTIVAYNGINERARMSGALSFAAQLQKSPEILSKAGFWEFNACSGSTVTDSSEKGNNATVAGTANWSTDTPSGSGCSFQFNGSTYLTTPLMLQSNYYLKSAWVKITSCTTGNNIISAPAGSNSHAWYAPSASCRMNAGHNGSWTSVTDSVTIGDGKWHHVAVEFTAINATHGALKMWRDGQLISTASSVIKPTVPESAGVLIGAYNGSNHFSGLMDDVMVITR